MKQKSAGLQGYLSQRPDYPERQAARTYLEEHNDIMIDITPIISAPSSQDIDVEDMIQNFTNIAGETPNVEMIQEGWAVLYDFCEAWDELNNPEVRWTAYHLLQAQTELNHGLKLMAAMEIISEKCLFRMRSAVKAMIESWIRHTHASHGDEPLVINIRLKSGLNNSHSGNLHLH